MSAAMTRDEFLALMLTARERLWSAFAGLSGEGMTQPGVNGDWSVKDILAHLAFWEEDARQRLELVTDHRAEHIRYYASGEEIDATNAEVYAARRYWMPAEAEQALRLARERLLKALTVLTDEQLQSTPGGISVLGWLAADTFEHDHKHLPQILAWRERS